MLSPNAITQDINGFRMVRVLLAGGGAPVVTHEPDPSRTEIVSGRNYGLQRTTQQRGETSEGARA